MVPQRVQNGLETLGLDMDWDTPYSIRVLAAWGGNENGSQRVQNGLETLGPDMDWDSSGKTLLRL